MIKEKNKYQISFSEYSTYLQCPHKWFLNYVLKIPSDTNEELVFGSALHDTIETMLTHRVLKFMAKDPNVVEGIFKDELKKQITDIKDIKLLKKFQEAWMAPYFIKQAKATIACLDIFNRFKDYEFVDVEYKLDGMPIIETDDSIITYKGFIDLVLKHKKTGRYLILDWKTSRKKWDINKKEEDPKFYNQLCLYKHFYGMAKNIDIDNIDLCFYNLPREEPEEQRQYDKNFTKIEIKDFIDKFADKCMDIFNFDHFHLEKAKIMTKKNFCSRCVYNNVDLCNDEDEFQVVDFHKL